MVAYAITQHCIIPFIAFCSYCRNNKKKKETGEKEVAKIKDSSRHVISPHFSFSNMSFISGSVYLSKFISSQYLLRHPVKDKER